MTKPISRRLSRIETEIQKKIGEPDRWRPGDPVFELIDNPRDPQNPKRLQEAEQFRRDNPNGLLFRCFIVHPPKGEPTWEHVPREERERYLAAYDRRCARAWSVGSGNE